MVVPILKKTGSARGEKQEPLQSEGWERIGGLPGGTVTGLAASPAFAHDQTFFAATMAGLFRWQDAQRFWQRVGGDLPGPFLTAVALSPDFARDGVILVASLGGGLFRSSNGGQNWKPGELQGRQVNFSALEISPTFSKDGACFAGTLADGVFCSEDRGATWESRNFGLLDLNVLDLALSPAFGRDETIFAGTATGVFRSQNGGRAWREVAFPSEAAPVQCLAISPNFTEDGTLFVGTEAAGIFRSTDRGTTWQPLGGALTGVCVNAMALSPGFAVDQSVLATTESAVWISRDAGESWSLCAELAGALCLGVSPTLPQGGPVLVGFSHLGIYRSAGSLTNWQMVNEGLFARLLTGLALSPAFTDDHRLFALGQSDGVFHSADEGVTWIEANVGLPSLKVNDLAIANGDGSLYAALPEGIWLSRRWGESWEQVSELPAQALALSPGFAHDATLIVGTNGQGLWISRDAGQSWQPLSVPWREHETRALALSPLFPNDGQVFVVMGRPGRGSVEVWQGRVEGAWEPIIHHQGTARSAVLAIPDTYPHNGRWYVALDDRFYRPVPDAGEKNGMRGPIFVRSELTRERPTIIDLAVRPGSGYLLAATNRGVYVSVNGGEEWHAFGQGKAHRAMVAVVPPPAHSQDDSIYALELGGSLWRLRQ